MWTHHAGADADVSAVLPAEWIEVVTSNYPLPPEHGAPGERERRHINPFMGDDPALPATPAAPSGQAGAATPPPDDGRNGASAAPVIHSRLLSRFPDLAGGLDQGTPAAETSGFPELPGDGRGGYGFIAAPLSQTAVDTLEGERVIVPEPEAVPRHRRSAGSVAREILETVILAALIFLAVRAVVQNFKVEGSSMVPSFIDGEYMLVNKAVYARIDARTFGKVLPWVKAGNHPMKYIFHGPERGDVIVFHPPPVAGGDKKDFIKRVVGKPGDTIDFHDNHVYVNDQEVIEPYIKARTDCQGQYCHLTLGQDQFFVMGDNRTNSSDSRFWGPVSAGKVIGKALLIYWCGGHECQHGWDHIGLAPNHSSNVKDPQPQPAQ